MPFESRSRPQLELRSLRQRCLFFGLSTFDFRLERDPPMPTNVIMPQMGESVAEGTVTKWIKKVGDRVERDEPLFEISTDKVDAEIPSPASGTLAKILVKESETVEVNTVVAVIDGEGAAAAAAPPAAPAKAAKPAAGPEVAAAVTAPPKPEAAPPVTPAPGGRAAAPPSAGEKVRSSPLVRRIAREHNVDVAQIPGTGQGGRVSK